MSERVLIEPWDLPFPATGEIVRDVEAVARGAMNVERWPIFLEPADNAELLGYLLGEAVILVTKYDRRDGIEARPWLFQRFRWKARDWRDSFMRHATLPELGELDGDEHGLNARASEGFIGAPGEVAGDRGDARPDALGRLLESGDRTLLREIEALGLSAPPGARGDSPEAQRRLDRLDRQRKRRVRELRLRDRPADQVAA